MKWLNDYAIITVGIVLVICMVFVLLWMRPVAASGGGDVAECEIVATTGTIDIYFCEPTLGPDFLINSVGFMLNED